ncbi:putative disease resistance RPP13-like protein 1 [Glycine soja]
MNSMRIQCHIQVRKESDMHHTIEGSLCMFIALPLRLWWVFSHCFVYHYLSNNVVHDLLPAMRQLRVLSLSHYVNITKLLDCLGNLIYLATKLKKMQAQIATLQNLQTLFTFVISKLQDGLKVGELKKFPHLQGKLSILKLQNVVDPSKAFQANLKKKEQIDEKSHIACLNSRGATYISVGQLHLIPIGFKLKSTMVSKPIAYLGSRLFYGSVSPSFQLFPSLKILSFKGILEWEESTLIRGTSIEFPSLSYLSLKDCLKLKGTLPNNLPSIDFKLSGCPLLVPMVCLELRKSLSTNVLSLIALESTNFILDLTISGTNSLASLRDGLPNALQYLILLNCEKLEFLPYESLHNYTSLKNLTIFNRCYSLTSFTLGCFSSLSLLHDLIITHCPDDSFSVGGLPTPNLIHLHMSYYDKLSLLSEPINTLASLQGLNIGGFCKRGFAYQATNLGSFLTTTISDWGLQRLTCPSILCIGGDGILNALMKIKVPLLPTSLVSLCIDNLYDIKCLDGKWLQHLKSLENHEISSSHQLKFLPKEGLVSSLLVMMKWKPVDLGCVTLNTNGFVSSYSGLETCGMKGAGEYVDYWNKLLKGNIWDLPNAKVLPTLLLSYHYLPSPLK